MGRRLGKRGRIAVCAAATLAMLPARAPADDGYVRLEGHGGPIKGVAVAPDRGQALTASFDYSVGLWDLDTNTLTHWLEGHEAAANAVAFLPEGRAVSVGDDFDMILWDLDSGQVLRRMEGHEGKLIAVTVSPDGGTVATSGWDGKAALWPLAGGEPVWLTGHQANVNGAVFAADGTIYTASYDGTIRHWQATGEPIETVVSHGFGINHLVINEAAGWLAYGAVDGAVRAIDLKTRDEIADLTAERRPILALAANPGNTRIAVGDGEGYIMVIDTQSWTILHDFRAAVTGPIWALAWDGEARLMAGGISDDAVLWPVEGGETLFAEGKRHFHKDPAEMSNGERQFTRKCAVCHDLTPGASRRAGPTLYGLFGRPAGTVEGYSYSEALANSSIIWGPETIDRLFDEGPDHFTPGSKMPMQRIAKLEDRRDLIDFLEQNTATQAGDAR
ncbi:c-type cytochrome [Rhodobacteraceae bacterium NNCM2]|nr:c-type cytochrome [Coraliihabitans acroporae]